MTTPTDNGSSLREHVAILTMRRLEIAAITVAVVAGALVLSVRQTPLYRAESDVLVKPAQNPSTAQFSLNQPLNLDTERLIVLSAPVARAVAVPLHDGTTVETLLKHASVDVVLDTE